MGELNITSTTLDSQTESEKSLSKDKVELIVGETTVWTRLLPIEIEFDNFRVLQKKEVKG